EKWGGSAVEISEDSIHDSQIMNGNKRFSLKSERARKQGLTLTSGQTWHFLTQIGVGGSVDKECMECRLEEMETRDALLYANATTENIAECAEEDTSLQ
ncbi:hypothetical protein Ancab_008755, partial [Ancistrocladus abbreviatus]